MNVNRFITKNFEFCKRILNVLWITILDLVLYKIELFSYTNILFDLSRMYLESISNLKSKI